MAQNVYCKGFEQHGWDGGNYINDEQFWGLIAKRGKGSGGSEDGPLWRVTYGDSETGLTEEEHVKRRDVAFSKECCPDTRDPGQNKVVRRETFLAFIDRRSRKNMRRIFGAHDVGNLLETDPFLALLRRIEGDAEATRKFLLNSSSIEYDFTSLHSN
ncbi:monooxygenase [Moelleriella libera RCEF 2490]|uniref:Monooxygenase n=1 Tax=Moelleriella libera RCEF 2490 TaxID=1081109 RepID=A0A162IJW1_9HYPO|nr:monooxygenase [Moelleriella libera RCEF 2490]